MKAINTKLAREFLRSKGVLLAISGIMVIGVACFVSMQTAYRNLNRAMTEYYRQCRMADFWISAKKIPRAELVVLENLPGIAALESRIVFYAIADLPSARRPINGMVVSLPDHRRPRINDLVVTRGDYFSQRRQNEVIINTRFAEAHRLAPGHRIHLLLNNQRQEFLIVGTAQSSEFTYLLAPGAVVPNDAAFGVFYIKQSFAEEVFDFRSAVNQVVGLFTPEFRNRPDELLRRAEARLESYGVTATTPRRDQASHRYLSNEISGLRVLAIILPAIFLSVAAVVLNVLVVRLVRQQRTMIGTLKALGYYSSQIFLHYVLFGAGVGLLGGVFGAALGFVMAGGLTAQYRKFFDFPVLSNEISPTTSLIGMAVSLACAVLGCVQGARSTLQLRPAEAMRPAPPKQGRRILLERWTAFWSRLSSSSRMVLRSVARNRLRTATGVFSAMAGAALLVTGFLMYESSTYLVDFQFKRVARSDFDIGLRDEHGSEVLRELQHLPAVDYVEPVLHVACTFEHGPYRERGAITGLVADSRLTVPRNNDGQPIVVPPSGLVVTRYMAKLLHVEPGDELTVIPTTGNRRERSMRVASIADSYLGLAVYADLHYLSQSMDETFAMNEVQLAVHNDRRQVNQLFDALKEMPAVQSISSRQEMIDSIMTVVLENQLFFIGVIVVFAGILFFGSILNASLVNLAERQSEVATMIALGYSRWQVGVMFLRESMLVNTLGTLLGLPAGYLLTRRLTAEFATEFLRLPLVTRPWNWITPFVFSVLFGLCAHAVVQWRIHQLDCVESLKIRE